MSAGPARDRTLEEQQKKVERDLAKILEEQRKSLAWEKRKREEREEFEKRPRYERPGTRGAAAQEGATA